MASYFFYIATSSVNIDGSVGLSQPAGSVAASATARRSISLAISQPPSAFNAPAVAKRSGTIALSQPTSIVSGFLGRGNFASAALLQPNGILAAQASVRRKITKFDLEQSASQFSALGTYISAVVEPVGYEWVLPKNVVQWDLPPNVFEFEIGQTR